MGSYQAGKKLETEESSLLSTLMIGETEGRNQERRKRTDISPQTGPEAAASRAGSLLSETL